MSETFHAVALGFFIAGSLNWSWVGFWHHPDHVPFPEREAEARRRTVRQAAIRSGVLAGLGVVASVLSWGIAE